MRLEHVKKKVNQKVYHKQYGIFPGMLPHLCVYRLKKAGRTASRAVPLAACDMLELGLIHSQSLAGSGIPIVMWSLTCTQHGFARGEQAEAGGRGPAVGGHPAVPFNGWIRCHIKKKKDYSWPGLFFCFTAGTGGQAFNMLGKKMTICFLKTLLRHLD